MAGDVARASVLLFGGSGAHGALDDTWTWDGTTWTEQQPAARPPPRADPALAFDSASGRTLAWEATAKAAMAASAILTPSDSRS